MSNLGSIWPSLAPNLATLVWKVANETTKRYVAYYDSMIFSKIYLEGGDFPRVIDIALLFHHLVYRQRIYKHTA